MLFYLFLFGIGLAFLIKGANFLVDGASSLAKKMGVSNIFIGLTIVAFGTSTPELIVNLFAAVGGSSDIAVGNIIGSNIANIFLILGISSIVFPLVVKKGTVWKEIPVALIGTILVLMMANEKALSRFDGSILLLFFAIFLYYSFKIRKIEAGHGELVRTYSKPICWLMILGGLLALVLGGKLIIDSSINIARFFKVSEAFIALTIVAVGTSLPELATSVVAAYKKNADIAVGNIVGSNIFNIGFILGLSALISPLSFSSVLNFDVLVAVFSVGALFIFMFIGRRHTLERWQGFIFLSLYIVYIIYLVVRG